MSTLQANEYVPFEQIKQVSEEGNEYWYARELALVLEYVQWRNFAKVLDRAKIPPISPLDLLGGRFPKVFQEVFWDHPKLLPREVLPLPVQPRLPGSGEFWSKSSVWFPRCEMRSPLRKV